MQIKGKLKTSLTFTALLSFVSVANTTLARGIKIENSDCKEIGRVYSSGDSNHPLGTLLCSGDTLTSPEGKSIEIMCYYSKDPSTAITGWNVNVESRCGRQNQLRVQNGCDFRNRYQCNPTKGQGNDNSVVIIQPFGSSLLDRHPKISWKPLLNATSYLVEVNGADSKRSWSRKVSSTSLVYPVDEHPLEFGNSYKIVIVAEKGNTVLAGGTQTINVLPEQAAKAIQANLDKIKSLHLASDQYLDIDSLYLSQGLLNESIKALQSMASSGNTKPELYLILGDRLLQAGFPELAKPKYEMAAKLAREQADSKKLGVAQAKLQLLASHNQSPASINGDQ